MTAKHFLTSKGKIIYLINNNYSSCKLIQNVTLIHHFVLLKLCTLFLVNLQKFQTKSTLNSGLKVAQFGHL